MADETPKHYGYYDFLKALKLLPNDVGTVAFSEFLKEMALDHDKQPVIRKYVELAKRNFHGLWW